MIILNLEDIMSSTDSTYSVPGMKQDRAFKNKDTNRGNPKGDKVDNSAGDNLKTSVKDAQKMGRKGSLAGARLPSGRLFKNT
jgi:hypothetical protein